MKLETADGLFSSGQSVDVECTWNVATRVGVVAIEIAKA
jgi:hypothetical protein